MMDLALWDSLFYEVSSILKYKTNVGHERKKRLTLEQTKSTNVASSSPMYSMIFLLIHGLIRRSINICKIKHVTKLKRACYCIH